MSKPCAGQDEVNPNIVFASTDMSLAWREGRSANQRSALLGPPGQSLSPAAEERQENMRGEEAAGTASSTSPAAAVLLEAVLLKMAASSHSAVGLAQAALPALTAAGGLDKLGMAVAGAASEMVGNQHSGGKKLNDWQTPEMVSGYTVDRLWVG
jgi:hypothetical protein